MLGGMAGSCERHAIRRAATSITASPPLGSTTATSPGPIGQARAAPANSPSTTVERSTTSSTSSRTVSLMLPAAGSSVAAIASTRLPNSSSRRRRSGRST